MNRLIIIGNGFDLAHGLKTDYNSFMIWYLKKCFQKAQESSHYEDSLISIDKKWTGRPIQIGEIRNTSQLIDYLYKTDLKKLFHRTLKVEGWANEYENPFSITTKSNFLRSLISQCNHAKWVDIENEFYEHLKDCNDKDFVNLKGLDNLNLTLKAIIEQLELYLSTLNPATGSSDYSDILNSYIYKEDIVGSRLIDNERPTHNLILNFNYTKTVEQYLKSDIYLPPTSIELNYIHGEINNNQNPLIFGFGDELDDDYKKMELTKANGFFEYIKSFWYFKTSNYHNLIRFLSYNEYQVYILGHSCGLSDRTLLNMIFEHPYCKSIKIYYHGDENKNNYKRLTQEISRHFRNKVSMREKIVPFDRSSPMPQIT